MTATKIANAARKAIRAEMKQNSDTTHLVNFAAKFYAKAMPGTSHDVHFSLGQCAALDVVCGR